MTKKILILVIFISLVTIILTFVYTLAKDYKNKTESKTSLPVNQNSSLNAPIIYSSSLAGWKLKSTRPNIQDLKNLDLVAHKAFAEELDRWGFWRAGGVKLADSTQIQVRELEIKLVAEPQKQFVRVNDKKVVETSVGEIFDPNLQKLTILLHVATSRLTNNPRFAKEVRLEVNLAVLSRIYQLTHPDVPESEAEKISIQTFYNLLLNRYLFEITQDLGI